MEQPSLVRTGRTVEEAIEIALLELGADRAEVAVDVLSKGRTGILGIGAEPAKVRVTRLSAAAAGDANVATAGLGLVNKFLGLLGVDATATISASGAGPDDPPVIEIEGADAGLLIGRRGETLQSFQFLVNMSLNRQGGENARVVLDVEQYRQRRQSQLRAMAQRMAERAVQSGRTVTLEPMSPADRRIIHMTLAENKKVITESVGDGNERRVTIKPTGAPAARPSPAGRPRDTRPAGSGGAPGGGFRGGPRSGG
ncbi:MAG: protein jag, partial [SAR202 cluster bacterium]|nr:protein jag [SAR202 cluster bacterium]